MMDTEVAQDHVEFPGAKLPALEIELHGRKRHRDSEGPLDQDSDTLPGP